MDRGRGWNHYPRGRSDSRSRAGRARYGTEGNYQGNDHQYASRNNPTHHWRQNDSNQNTGRDMRGGDGAYGRNSNDQPWLRDGGNRQEYSGGQYNQTRGNGGSSHNNRGGGPRNNYGSRKNVGFKYVQELLSLEDTEEVLSKLKKDQEGFVKMLTGEVLSDDLVVLTVKLILKVCHGCFSSVVQEVIGFVMKTKFLKFVTDYVSNITHQSPNDKGRNKLFWNNTDEFWNNILQLSEKVLEIMPSITCESIKKILKTMQVYFPSIEKDHHIQIPDEIKAKTDSLLEHIDHLIKQHQSATPQKKQNTGNDMHEKPPEDFHDIPVIPAPLEVTQMTTPFLRKNIIDQAYESVHQYLDIQFRLLRQDFVTPLRKGIVTYLENQRRPNEEKRKLENIRVYPKIQFVNIETVNECNCYKIIYDFRKKKMSFTYENSRRFMFGSLVCFTKDNFQTMLFGKIVQRDTKLLEQSMLIVGFQEEVDVDYESDYIMVESSVYFEPYYQVLNVLKQMKAEEFPMERYIIKIEKDARYPQYLNTADPVVYDIGKHQVMPKDWPKHVRFYDLNDSQLSAFEAAMTQEFCIVQGPPGTGKTFLGLKIAHTLLKNSHAWYNKSPILVICYTNHALDQFLEGLLPVTKQILRVGGQSKNENLNQFNIRNKKGATDPNVYQLRKEVQDCHRDIKTIAENLHHIVQNDSIINFRVFEEVVDNYQSTWFYHAKPEAIKQWLLAGKNVGRGARPPPPRDVQKLEANSPNVEMDAFEGDAEEDLEAENRETLWQDEIFDGVIVQEYTPLLYLEQLRTKASSLKEELLKLRKRPIPSLDSFLQEETYQMEIWETEQDLTYLERKLGENQERLYQRMAPPEFVDLQQPHRMPIDNRWQLYFYWLGMYYRSLRAKHEEASVKFRERYRVYTEMRSLGDAQVMKSNLVVGMTTTGAARLQSSLQALRSPIVIVEEAAEVLEAHIVAALTHHCKHLILIGDHKQLKPSAADYRIETNYQLGVSLFERMVKNNIQCHTLNVQHRMRPEISRLIRPAIYPNLQDHYSTLERLPILGIQKPLYFLDHQEQEDLCQDNSKKNIHEARFIIALARHIVLNGYKPEQITILAAYLGQMFEMLREKKKPLNNNLLKDVRIAVLDNYQGEESDIILLSLVRSNAENRIGFLKIQNRVCVALSRARDGFYIMGNMKMLCDAESENNIWHQVKQTLHDQNAIGAYLSLKCQIHSTITQVSKADDFITIAEGGCRLICGKPVSCGHICKRLCHVQDRDHQLYKCREPCGKLLCDTNPTHICKRLCYQDCGPCTYPVLRTLPECRHSLRLACHIDVNTYLCQVKVETKLPCDHTAMKPCSADPMTFKCPHPCDTRVEPCGHACDRMCHIRVDPDHLQYKCKEPCAKRKVGCMQNDNPHGCTMLCFQECEPCDVGVKKYKRCGHVHTIACKLDVEYVLCERSCKITLPCGHKCKNKCEEPCGPCNIMICCQDGRKLRPKGTKSQGVSRPRLSRVAGEFTKEAVEKIISECGHKIKKKCHLEPLRKECQSRVCSSILPCGHKCKNFCSKPCTTQCKETVDVSLKSPCGHIVKRISCYLRSTTDPEILLKNCSEPCGAGLKCEHKCSGTCGECLQGRIHKRCGAKCGLILVCNHECPNPCREACRPCIKPCEMRCQHTRCKKKCGEPCTPCAENCTRRCPHVNCTKKCSEICDVEPCTVRCRKRLKCGHPCVGFCNDPCPILCKICDNDKLTDIFLGNEDEEGAIYVMLNDCKHIFESGDMEQWLASDNGEDRKDRQVQPKVCPRCKTNITTTERYSKYIKQAVQDVMKVKEIAYGHSEQNDRMREELLAEVHQVISRCPQDLQDVCSDIQAFSKCINERLQLSKNQRRQPINAMEIHTIKSKLQLFAECVKCFDRQFKLTSKSSYCLPHLSMIIAVLLRDENQITNQESEDLQLEITRLHRIIQHEQIKQTRNFDYYYSRGENNKVKPLSDQIGYILNSPQKYNDSVVQQGLKQLSERVAAMVNIDLEEKREIIQAMNMSRGHWYKCPNGHVYVIGECGQPMQVSKCPECKSVIGGTSHRFASQSTPANDFLDIHV